MSDQETEQFGERIDQAACPSCGRAVDLSAASALGAACCPGCGARLFVPVQLGAYRVVGLLGKGTTAAVYRAVDGGLDREVAIKVMHLKSKGDDDAVGRFLAEARALAALRHRNVVRIFTMGRDRDVPYLVMELVGGGSVRNLITKGRPADEAAALEIAIGVAEGLQAAYAIGLIHGDIKPANILLDEQGAPKIVDFGLARFGGVRMEREGLGTPFYVPPERVRQRDTDHRGDIYSLGATLYHLLAGQPVFDGASVKDVLLAHIRRPAPDARHHCPFLGAKTATLLARMLRKDPGQRHATYDELLSDLREALRCAAPAGAPEPAPDPPESLAAAALSARSARQPARKGKAPNESARRVAIAVGAVLAVALIGAAWLVANRLRSDAEQDTSTYLGNPPRSAYSTPSDSAYPARIAPPRPAIPPQAPVQTPATPVEPPKKPAQRPMADIELPEMASVHPGGAAAPAAAAAVAPPTPPRSAQAGPPDTVSVGDPGNQADTTGFGSVAYEYRIGRYEVTNAQYCDFLNAVARTDPHGLYQDGMAGEYGGVLRAGPPGGYTYAVKDGMGDRPVNFVSWYTALRYANWLTNGRGQGDTERGSYTFTPQGGGWTVTQPDHAALARGSAVKWVLASEDEWYKAAYYDPNKPGGAGYWLFAGRSDNPPACNINTNVPSAVGSFKDSASPYGTYDQNGNLWEWNETQANGKCGVRGGSFYLNDNAGYLRSSTRYVSNPPTFTFSNYGFRVVALGAAGPR